MGLKDVVDAVKDVFTPNTIKEKQAAEAAAKEAAEKAAKEAAAKEAAEKAAKEAAAKQAAEKAAAEAEAKKTVAELAREVIRGDWGNGQERKDRLTAAGYDYGAVQDCVNDILKTGGASVSTGAKSVEEVAREVIRGDWGNGQERKDRLTAAGYDYSAVQGKVNELL